MNRKQYIAIWIHLTLFLAVCLSPGVYGRDSLFLHYAFEEGTGTDIGDSSGNGRHAVAHNIAESAWGGGRYGRGLKLDGSDDYVKSDGAFDPPLDGDFTMSVWFTATAGLRARVFSFTQEGNLMINLRVINDILRLDDNGGVSSEVSGNINITDGAWHHIVAVRSGQSLTVYLDGETHLEAAVGNVLPLDAIALGRRDRSNPDDYLNGKVDECTIYAEALGSEEIPLLMERLDLAPEKASLPNPEDESTDVLRDVVLTWEPGVFAGSHDVYVGSSFNDVNEASRTDPRGVLLSEGQTANTINAGRLDFGQTTYWRVDEVNATSDGTIHRGNIWSFTVESLAYPVTPVEATASSSFMPTMGAERTIDGSGLNAMDQHDIVGTNMWLTGPTDTERWIQYRFDKPQKLHEMLVWNSNQTVETFIGFGSKSVTVETSLDGSNWTALTDVPEFAQAPGTDGYTYNTTVAFGGVTVHYVKLTLNSWWGAFTTQTGLSEVRFLAVPVYAAQPQPANGSTVDSVDVTLTWRPGRDADTHEVLLSTDPAAVEAGSAVVGNPTDSRFTPAPLNYGTEYFWAINEVNNVAETPRYEGDLWSFKAPEYLVIDDFELYADKEFLEIWAFWADGYQNDNNGAIVGNGNAGATDVFYQGRQSMPIHYDNSGAAVSEVTRTFSPLLDWSKGAPTTLSLQIRGDAPAFIDGGDTLTVGGSGGDIWNVADEFRFVYKTLNGNGSITAKVESLTHVHDWAKAGVMIRESLTAESTCAFTVATGASGVTFQYRTAAFTNAASDSSVRDASWAEQEEPVWVRVERIGDEFNGYISLDGVTWMPSVNNPQTISMLPEVKIGFCVTSHDNTQSSTAVFSNVATTGSVSGTWTTEEFGEGHPDNDAAPMYLVVTDSNGREKAFSHPDSAVTVDTNWAPWQIPLNDMGSVNPGSIEKITIGVGTPGGSATGAQGTVYVDLLQVGTPLVSE